MATMTTAMSAAIEERCQKCGLAPMVKIAGGTASYCLNCVHQAAAEAEADGLNEWMAAAKEYEAERDKLRAALAEIAVLCEQAEDAVTAREANRIARAALAGN
jgi:hypothetical protein